MRSLTATASPTLVELGLYWSWDRHRRNPLIAEFVVHLREQFRAELRQETRERSVVRRSGSLVATIDTLRVP